MTNPSIFREIEDLFRQIDREVEAQDVDDIDAEDLIKHLTKDGGGIEVLYADKFVPQSVRPEDVKSMAKPHYDISYGLDGSTTKHLSYNNGLILSVGVAEASVTGSDDVQDISDRGTISVVAYFDENQIDVTPNSKDNTKVHFNQFPRVSELNSDLPNWVSSIARSHAEGVHFEWISKDIDGPLFVDGPLLPADILTWVMYEADRQASIEQTPMEAWSEMVNNVLQRYINGIENCIVNGNTVYGVQKSTTATRVIDALKKKEPKLEDSQIPHTNDGTLFNSALSPNNEEEAGYVRYTPWYVENKFDIGFRDDRLVTPLKNCNNIELQLGNYEDYKRAFFFAKPPTDDTVYRIGVPKMILETGDPERIRNIALSEMTKQFQEPLPVVVADEKVRIPRDLREKFRSLITSADSHVDKNQQRGYQ